MLWAQQISHPLFDNPELVHMSEVGMLLIAVSDVMLNMTHPTHRQYTDLSVDRVAQFFCYIRRLWGINRL